MNVTVAGLVAQVIRAAYVDQDPAAALRAARDLAASSGEVLLAAGLPHVQLDEIVVAPAVFDEVAVPRCFHCGCTDEIGCPGGCEWVARPEGGDLCSRCAHELTLLAAALEDAARLSDACGTNPDADRCARYRQLLAGRYGAYLLPS